MFKRVLRILLILCLCAGAEAKAQSANDATTIIIMRHAEKEISKHADPELSAAGKLRAEHLAILFKDVAVGRLMATPYKRTQHTLFNISADKGLKIESYAPSGLPVLAKELQDAKGQTIMIAGHANTAPDLVNLLLNEHKYTQLNEDEFGKIWILTMLSGKVIACTLINTN